MLLSDKSVSYDKEELIFQTKNYCKEYINKIQVANLQGV